MMKKGVIVLIMLAAFPVFAQQVADLKIVKHNYFDKLPSASGVEFYKDKIYVVADDLPWLFELDKEWKVLNKYPVSGISKIENGRTPKNIKADFESIALAEYNNYAFSLILSSGSKRVKRDTAYLFSLNGKRVAFKKNLRPWYEKIKSKSGMSVHDEINIEGVTIVSGKIYVVHRGNISGNFIAVSSFSDFIQYFTGNSKQVPPVKVYPFTLSTRQGVMAGLSGLCSLPNEKGLLVTASLEATGDVVSDGAVLGSYLGYISYENLEKGSLKLTPILGADRKMLAKKQEGVIVTGVDKQGIYRAYTVCDNDDGTSDIFEMSFQIR